MIDQQSMLFKVFKLVCYVSLAAVIMGLAFVFILALNQSCGQLDLDGVECDTANSQLLGEIGMGILWATVYTLALPILALAGAYFGIEWMVQMERRSADSKKS